MALRFVLLGMVGDFARTRDPVSTPDRASCAGAGRESTAAAALEGALDRAADLEAASSDEIEPALAASPEAER